MNRPVALTTSPSAISAIPEIRIARPALLGWGAAFLALAIWLWRPIRNATDLWLHLAAGRWICQTHHIPRADPFSWTVHGHAWTDHEWLLQWGWYHIYQAGGVRGLMMWKVMLVGVVALGVAVRLVRSGRPHAVQVATWAVAIIAARYGWQLRADLVSVALAACFAARLDALSTKNLRPADWIAWPIVFGLAANLHAGFIVSLGFGACVAVGWVIAGRKKMAAIWVWLGLCLLATLCNPWGFGLYQSTVAGLRYLSEGAISEWGKTPLHPMELFWGCLGVYWAVLVIRLRRDPRAHVGQLLVGLFLSWIAIRHVRNTPYFLMAAFPGVLGARGASSPSQRFGYGLTAAASVVALLLAIPHAQTGVDVARCPVEACRWISAHTTTDRFYNDYSFGTYWLWVFDARRPVFIDGRLHAVDGYPALFEETTQAKRSPATWTAFLAKHRVEAALVSNPDPGNPGALQAYFPKPAWRLDYADSVAMIFSRRVDPAREAATK